MQEINWDNFNSNFSGRQQHAFEILCYQLFCKQYNKPIGIDRYENHAGIETDPITVDERHIGWQAKYYDTRLSEHKQELIDAITTAKKRHPGLTDIEFFLNKGFGQDKKKTDPQYKKEIEKHAESQDVKITWKGPSYFESPFVAENNTALAKHYFSLGESVHDLINKITEQTASILKPIRSDIQFNKIQIKIDRNPQITDILEKLLEFPSLIISGNGGSGKTAIIKDFYSSFSSKFPIFCFKATDFDNRRSVDEIFHDYGDFNASDFATAFTDVKTKIIVVDSAERLSEIADKTAFNQFIDMLHKNGWKFVFTTRRNFVSDLTTSLVDVYGLNFSSIDISELSKEELIALSRVYKFKLPNEERLAELVQNPFYLHEYLQYYDENKGNLDYVSFKDNLWKKQIAKNDFTKDNVHLERDSGFIKLAIKRANQGGFSVDPGSDITSKALNDLRLDEVIAFDDKTGGYFITHDVYEEWALEKFIDRSFNTTNDTESFFATLGDSRPVRRAFRGWISDRLQSNKQEASSLINETLSSDKVSSHWRDEVLVSSLLSGHAKELLSDIQSELLSADGELLRKVTFLLRVACKDIDEDFLHRLGIDRFRAGTLLGSLYTIPRGTGWSYIIKLIYENKEILGLSHWTLILNLLKDWTNKNKSGETTKYAAKIGLFYYESIADEDALYSLKDLEKTLIEVILCGSSEIRKELGGIIDTITSDYTFDHRSRYYPMTKYMLGSILESTDVSNAIPNDIIRLAEHVWMLPKPEDPYGFGRSRIDIDDDFGLSSSIHEYYPASSLQTPIGVLLNAKQDEALDSIVRITNKSIAIFMQSELSTNETEEITLRFLDGTEQKQAIGTRLWEMYRGTHVAPDLLESIHMALEKWLLGYVATANQEDATNMCLKLLRNSESASITAIVTSVVFSQPFKLTQVALVLFKTKELFNYERTRNIKDRTHKSGLESLRDMLPRRNYIEEIHQNERIEACDVKHRTMDLENLAVYYQFFKAEDITDEASSELVKQIWNILDQYYADLPLEKLQSETDKVWRLCLARMDRRKMKPKTENKDGQTLINFNPQIDPKLKKYSEDALEENDKSMVHITLSLWARYKWEKKADYEDQYKVYDKDHKKAVAETKVVIEKIQAGDKHVGYFEYSTPIYVAGVLIRDYKDKLTKGERDWCAKIILEVASTPSTAEYDPQIGDGVSIAISSLPNLVGINEETDELITVLLLYTLFNLNHIGGSQTLSDIAVVTILHNLWKVSDKFAQSIFVGYITLKPAYDKTREKVRQTNLKVKKYETSEHEVIKMLDDDYEKQIEDVLSEKTKLEEVLENAPNLDISSLAIVFELIPYRTKDDGHKKLAQKILKTLSEKLVNKDDEDRYFHAHNLFEKITHFILTSDKSDIESYLEPFITNFEPYKSGSDLLEAFLSAADKLPDSYENFWHVWDLYYPKILEISKNSHLSSWDTTVIHNYLFAWMYFKEDAREWHILKDSNRKFFEKVVKEFGSPIPVLYSLAKIVFDVGSNYLEDGIAWLSELIESNSELEQKDWEVNTLYHLEYALKKYVARNREKIRKAPRLKKKVLTILNIMINKGSVVAYLLREDVL